jgi:putative FmdB family regulatory protein
MDRLEPQAILIYLILGFGIGLKKEWDMPIYEYRCKSCGHVIEVLESASEKGKHACPKCGQPGMQKIFSAFGVEKGGSSSSAGSCPTGTCPLN